MGKITSSARNKQKCFNFIIVLVGVNASSASECYDWPGVDVLRQRVLNSYVLIPVIFLLRSHTAEFRQFTGNAATSRTGKLPERSYWYFWKGQFTGNSQEKSVCVKRLVVSSVCWPWFVVRLDIYSQTLKKGLLSFSFCDTLWVEHNKQNTTNFMCWFISYYNRKLGWSISKGLLLFKRTNSL